MAVTRTSGTSGAGDPVARPPLTDCRARDVLNRVGTKWSVFVIDRLGQGSQRFNELHRTIDGITGRMLTVTLRGLERDGLVAPDRAPGHPAPGRLRADPDGRHPAGDDRGAGGLGRQPHQDISAARSNYDARRTPDEPCTADEPFTTDETPCPGDEAACDASRSRP